MNVQINFYNIFKVFTGFLFLMYFHCLVSCNDAGLSKDLALEKQSNYQVLKAGFGSGQATFRFETQTAPLEPSAITKVFLAKRSFHPAGYFTLVSWRQGTRE